MARSRSSIQQHGTRPVDAVGCLSARFASETGDVRGTRLCYGAVLHDQSLWTHWSGDSVDDADRVQLYFAPRDDLADDAWVCSGSKEERCSTDYGDTGVDRSTIRTAGISRQRPLLGLRICVMRLRDMVFCDVGGGARGTDCRRGGRELILACKTTA